MDPTQALVDALFALRDCEVAIDRNETKHTIGCRRQDAADALAGLCDWLNSGGFPPHMVSALQSVAQTNVTGFKR